MSQISANDRETQLSLARLSAAISSNMWVLFITGAGTSVASGVPAYRTGENSVWGNWMYEWGTRRKFMADPESWWNDFWLHTHETDTVSDAKPCASHEAISQLMRRFRNVHLATQNVDHLHHKSGVDPARYIEVHGALGFYRCTDAKCTFGCQEALQEGDIEFVRGPNGRVIPPQCPECGSLVMPMSLLFDESYSTHQFFQHDKMAQWLDLVDVIVFVGTSFSVNATSHALRAAVANGADVYVFDVDKRTAAVREQVALMPRHVVGPCQDTLPRLASLCKADCWRLSDWFSPVRVNSSK